MQSNLEGIRQFEASRASSHSLADHS